MLIPINVNFFIYYKDFPTLIIMHYALSIINRAISDLGWRQFRILLEGKAQKYGRDFRVISRP